MATIEFDAVTKRYKDGTEAVRQLDLDIQDGEFMILVGPSGCGKSTALRMIAGLEDVSEGELKIGGDVVNDLAPRDRDIAMVFQNYALYPHMSVRDNMGFALKLAKVDKSEINRKVTEAAEMLDLTEQLDRKPANLSGGQRQRVAMGRAIVREPKAFLMDEPLSNLDAKLRVQTRAQIARLQERLGTTTVYVTHDQTEAMTLGDRVCVLRKGVVQQVGTPRDLYQDPANLFVAGFIGSPGMNFMPARIEGETVKLPFGEVRLDDQARQALDRHRGNGAAGGRNVIVGMRPEHFTDAREPLVHGGHEGLEFSAVVDVVESLGSENFAYFHAKQHDGVPESAAVESLGEHAATADMPSTVADGQVIARLGPGTEVSHGDTIELRLDTSELRFFEPESGESLTR